MRQTLRVMAQLLHKQGESVHCLRGCWWAHPSDFILIQDTLEAESRWDFCSKYLWGCVLWRPRGKKGGKPPGNVVSAKVYLPQIPKGHSGHRLQHKYQSCLETVAGQGQEDSFPGRKASVCPGAKLWRRCRLSVASHTHSWEIKPPPKADLSGALRTPQQKDYASTPIAQSCTTRPRAFSLCVGTALGPSRFQSMPDRVVAWKTRFLQLWRSPKVHPTP